jgi:hypothetical protein
MAWQWSIVFEELESEYVKRNARQKEINQFGEVG